MGQEPERRKSHPHQIKVRFVVPTKKPESLKQEEIGEVQSKKQSTHWHFIYFYLGKMVWGGALGSQADLAAAAATKEVGVWGRRRGQGLGGAACSLPPTEAQKIWRKGPEIVWSPREWDIFSKLHRKGSQSPRTQNLSQSRPGNPGETVLPLLPLDCTVHLSHFKCKWRQWRCKGDGEKDINCVNKINWKQDFDFPGIFPLVL